MALAIVMGVMLPVSAFAQLGPAPVNLGTAGNFAVLAETAITNVPSSAITGDVGISPNGSTSITGFDLIDQGTYATSTQVTGRVYGADMDAPTPTILTAAIGDMLAAYTDAAGRPDPEFVELNSGNIGGSVLIPGLYRWSGGVTAPTSFVIDGGPDDVWIFQIAGDLSLASDVNVTLSGGAQAHNIFWQVTAANIATNAHIEGIILAGTAINLQTGASFNGRALAQSAVTLQMNVITEPTPAPPGGCDVTMTGTAAPLSLSQGRVEVDLAITNNGATAQELDLWSIAMGPAPQTKFYGNGILPADTTFNRHVSFKVAGHVPAGTYVVTFYVGDFTNAMVCDEVAFVVEKLPHPQGLLASASAEAGVTGVSPNPFSNEASVRFTLTDAADVRLTVYDVLGRQVAVLVEGTLDAGSHTATFDARGLSPGTYVYRLVTGSTVQTGRMTLAN